MARQAHRCTDGCAALPRKPSGYSMTAHETAQHVRSYDTDGRCWCGHWHEEKEFNMSCDVEWTDPVLPETLNRRTALRAVTDLLGWAPDDAEGLRSVYFGPDGVSVTYLRGRSRRPFREIYEAEGHPACAIVDIPYDDV